MNNLKMLVIRLTILLLVVSGVAFGQAGQSAQNSAQESLRASAPSDGTQLSPDRPALQHRNPRYQVMRDDTLTVSFPLAPELNQKVIVQPDGYITLQNLGSVYIQGMTVPEIVETLKKAYANV